MIRRHFIQKTKQLPSKIQITDSIATRDSILSLLVALLCKLFSTVIHVCDHFLFGVYLESKYIGILISTDFVGMSWSGQPTVKIYSTANVFF